MTTTGCLTLLVAAAMFLYAECGEPKCSKYDYDERMLEKMIRMEFTFEKVLHEMKTTKHEVKTELDTLREERNRLKEEVSALKHDMEETAKENLANSRETFEMFKAQIRRMSEDLRTFRNQSLVELKGLLAKPLPRVEFRAHGLVDTTPTDGQVMAFSNVEFNQGQGYDPKTGYFTAPVAGTYLLMVQICMLPPNYMYFNIVVDDVVQTVFQASAYNYNFCITWTPIAYMDVGSKAWLRSKRTVGSNVLQLSSSKHRNSFSGILIRMDS